MKPIETLVLAVVACGAGCGESPPVAQPAPAPIASPVPTPAPSTVPDASVLVEHVTGSALAIDANEVFYGGWEQSLSPASTQLLFGVRAVAKAGGPPRLVAYSPDFVVDLVANDAWVYWTTSDGSPRTGLYRAPAGGGATELVLSGNHFSEIAIDDGAAYVANYAVDGPGSGAVYGVPHAGGSPAILQAGITMWGWRSGLAVDAHHVYFVDDPPPANLDGTDDSAFIKRVPKSGGAAETIVTCHDEWRCGWFSLRVDGDHLYARDRTGQVLTLTKDGLTTVTVSPSSAGQQLDVSGSTICWNTAWSGPRSDPNPYPAPGIRCTDVEGTQAYDVDVGLYGWEGGPRVDDRYVYYVKADALIRHVR